MEFYYIMTDKSLIIEAVKQDSGALAQASEIFKNDKEVVLEAVKKYGWSLRHASERLKNDREIVLEAIKQDGKILYYASKNLQNDKQLLEFLESAENLKMCNFHPEDKKWFEERMKVLANIREKEIMESSIPCSNKKNKTIKF